MSKSKAVGKLLDKFLGKVKGAGQKAGTAIRDFDDKYSEKIAGLYENANPVAQAAAYTMGGAHPSFRRAEVELADNPQLQAALSYAIPAANAIPKYALPAAGVTLAGKALIDIANLVNSGLGDGQEQGQIDMGQVAGFTALGAGVAAGPSIHNAIRDPKNRMKPVSNKTLAGLIAGGAGIGGLANVAGQSIFN